MKKIVFLLLLASAAQALGGGEARDGISEQEALELGMTPYEEYINESAKAIDEESFASGVADEDKARVVIIVNKAKKGTHPDAQTMRVYLDGVFVHAFVVSTGSERRVTTRAGKSYISTTPTGYFRPRRLYRRYFSSLWGGATMHYSVFYIPNSGIALHATTPSHYHELGSRASGGCVRLRPEDAKTVQDLVLETSKLKDDIFAAGDFAHPSFLYDEPVRASNGKRYIRKRYKENKWQRPVLGVYRRSGQIYNETKWKSTDTLIVVKNGDTI